MLRASGVSMISETDVMRAGQRRQGEAVMSDQLKGILEKYVKDIHQLYGNDLKTVILYGSYARGDFGPDSDIDIMILVDF